MQKQHLHLTTLICMAVFALGCADINLPKLNPYLHGDQAVTFEIPDSVAAPVRISGWTFEVQPPKPGDDGGTHVWTPDGRQLLVGWQFVGDSGPLAFLPESRSLWGLVLRHKELELAQYITISPDGGTLTCRLEGANQRQVSGVFQVLGSVAEPRGAAAYEDPWQLAKTAATVTLPWGAIWRFESSGTLATENTPRLGATATFPASEASEFKLVVGQPTLDSQVVGFDIVTDSERANLALALLVSQIPPTSEALPGSAEEVEYWADLALAQWITRRAELTEVFRHLQGRDDPEWILLHAVSAFETAFRWGTLPRDSFVFYEPLVEQALNSLDVTLRSLAQGATLEERLREACVWNFAEVSLTGKNAEERKAYRNRSREASKEVVKALRALRAEYRESRRTPKEDSLLFEDRFLGDAESGRDQLTFVPPDSIGLLRIAARGTLTWLVEADRSWLEPLDMPWDVEQARLLWNFEQSIRFRKSDRWSIAEAALLQPLLPARLPDDDENHAQARAAAGELKTIVEGYLGVRPNWRARKLTIDPRLPEEWGRTRARIPFERGELYLDLDPQNGQAIFAARGLKQKFEGLFYLPTASGAISTQFVWEPGDAPILFKLFTDAQNVTEIRTETVDLSE